MPINNSLQEVMSVGDIQPFSQLLEAQPPVEVGKKVEENPLITVEKAEVKVPELVKKQDLDGLERIEKAATAEKKPEGEQPKSRNAAFLVAESFKKDGIFPEDLKFEENITSKDLKNRLLETAKQESLDIARSELEQKYNENVLRTADLINKGINPDDLNEVNFYKRISAIRLGDDEEKNIAAKEWAIKSMYTDQGLPEKRISKLVADAMDEDEGDSDFQEAQKYFGNKARNIESEMEATAEQNEKAAQKQQEQLNKEFKSLIKSGDIYNTKDEKAKKDLESFLFDPTETVKIDNKTYKVTGFQKKFGEYNNDLKKQLTFAKLLMSDFDLSAIEENGKLSKAGELDSLLEAVVEPGNGKSPEHERAPKGAFDFSKLTEISDF